MNRLKQKHLKITLIRIFALGYGIIIFIIAYGIYKHITMAGFPDGHLTPYDQAIHTPLTVCNWINIIFSFYFFYLAFAPSTNKLGIKFMIMLFLHILFFIFTTYGIEYYYKDYLGLEHGQGG